MIRLGEHFRRDDTHRHSRWLRQQRWFLKAREDRERKEKLADKQEKDLDTVVIEIVMAETFEIEAFEAKLDAYDAAIIEALIDNQGQLDAVNARIQDMLERAYVMEDGRRVFKTEDGTQVFDEFGTAASGDEIDFEAISNDKPTWEAYSAKLANKDDLELEREQLFESQKKVDQARDAISDGEIPRDELDELDADLLDAMPSSVRAHIPGLEPEDGPASPASPDARSPFTAELSSIPQP